MSIDNVVTHSVNVENFFSYNLVYSFLTQVGLVIKEMTAYHKNKEFSEVNPEDFVDFINYCHQQTLATSEVLFLYIWASKTPFHMLFKLMAIKNQTYKWQKNLKINLAGMIILVQLIIV